MSKVIAINSVNVKESSQESYVGFDVDSPDGKEYLQEQMQTTTHKEYSLDYNSWLPFAAKSYSISPRIEDYVIVNVPMIPSDIPNRNGIAFPLHELVRFRGPPVNRLVYKAWTGCPTHQEHQDKKSPHGIILDTSLRRIKNFGGGKHWMVMALLAFDKTKYADRATQILMSQVNTYSMGATCDHFTCGLSGVRLDDPRYAYRLQKPVEFESVPDPITGEKTLLFRNAHILTPAECSTVDDPAWVPARSDTIFEI